MNVHRPATQIAIRVGPTPPTADELDALGRRAIGMAMTGEGEQAAAMMLTAYAAAAGARREKEAKE